MSQDKQFDPQNYLPVPETLEQAIRERNGWCSAAAQHLRNEEFYRGIVCQIGDMFGVAARTSDDGSVHDGVLALRVPELVSAALATMPEAGRPFASHEEALMRDKQPCLECARVEARATDTKRLFALGDRVCKTRGSSWNGIIVGFYSTALTPVGYAVESEREPGSVQIYPESALDAAKLPEVDSIDSMTKWCRMLTKEVKRLDDMTERCKKVDVVSERLGGWLSAALEDPQVCEEMKQDIRDWFAARTEG